MDDAVETLGARIRNRLGPYQTLIDISKSDRFTAENIKELLRSPITEECLKELILISGECEIEPSPDLIDRLDK